MDPEKNKESEVTVDDILQILGPFGKFNIFSYVLILFPVLLAGMYSSVYNFEAMDLRYKCSTPECEDPEVNFTIPHMEDGSPSKCLRYALFNVTDFTNSTQNNDTCSPHHFDTSSEIECDSYVYFEEHSIVKELKLLDLGVVVQKKLSKMLHPVLLPLLVTGGLVHFSTRESELRFKGEMLLAFLPLFHAVTIYIFNLGCQDWKRSLVGTVHNAGFFISIPLTGLISDRFGRRLALVFASVANGVFGVIRAFSLSYEMFIVLEFLEPALGGGVYTACFVLALELVGPKGRVFVSLMFNTMFILGGVTVTLLSWWLQSWRYLLLVIYIPAILVFFYLWTLTESFRWLFSKGRYEEGLNVLSRCEKVNKATVPKDHYDQVEKNAIKQREARKCEVLATNQSTFKQLLLSPMIWKRLFTCSFLWTTSTLVYYGLSINAIELSGNSYLNYIVVIVIEAPANVCKLICLDRFGRKRVIATAFMMTGIILITYGFLPGGNWSTAFYLGGKFFITLAYNSLYIFAAEVFPTNYRTTLLAICSTIGRIGSAVAPQTPLLSRFYEYLPTLVFGVMSALSGLLVLTLPETNNQKLPDSLKEAQEQDKQRDRVEIGDREPERRAETKTRL